VEPTPQVLLKRKLLDSHNDERRFGALLEEIALASGRFGHFPAVGERHVVGYDRCRRHIGRLSGERVDWKGGRGGMGADVVRSEGAAHASIRTGLTRNNQDQRLAQKRAGKKSNHREEKRFGAEEEEQKQPARRKNCEIGFFPV